MKAKILQIIVIAFAAATIIGVSSISIEEDVSTKEEMDNQKSIEVVTVEERIPEQVQAEIEVPEEETVEETEEVETEEVVGEINETLVFTDSEEDMLLRLGMSEAGIESTECIAMVMCVILNRVDSDNFPNTISDVITESGQFSVVSNGSYYSVEPNEKCYAALEMIESGWDESNGALYFEACANGSSWHNTLEFICQIDNTRFYK